MICICLSTSSLNKTYLLPFGKKCIDIFRSKLFRNLVILCESGYEGIFGELTFRCLFPQESGGIVKMNHLVEIHLHKALCQDHFLPAYRAELKTFL